MTKGRENLIKAIEFTGPEYLPCGIGMDLDFIHDKDAAKTEKIRELISRLPHDVLGGIDCFKNREHAFVDGVERITDEWGTKWLNDGHGSITTYHPLEQGYPAGGEFIFPDVDMPGRFDEAREYLADRGSRYVCVSVWFTLFERLWMLRGFNNALMDVYIDTENLLKLKGQILDVNLRMIDKFLELGVDAIFFSDDWGSQRGLLMNPDDWRRYFKPDYIAMFRRVRDAGAHVWFHSCGDVSSIIGDLLEAGMNVLHPVQPQAMDVEALSRKFGGRLCFNGGVDVQGTMVKGTPQDVKNEVYKLYNLFGRFCGGYICGTSHSIMPETPLENVIALLEAYFDVANL